VVANRLPVDEVISPDGERQWRLVAGNKYAIEEQNDFGPLTQDRDTDDNGKQIDGAFPGKPIRASIQ